MRLHHDVQRAGHIILEEGTDTIAVPFIHFYKQQQFNKSNKVYNQSINEKKETIRKNNENNKICTKYVDRTVFAYRMRNCLSRVKINFNIKN